MPFGGSTDTRRFVTDPSGRIIGEYGTSATDPGSGSGAGVKAEFIWMNPIVGAAGMFGGDDGLGGYVPAAVATAGGTITYVHGDHMGVPVTYTDAAGTAIAAPSGYSVPGFPGQSQTFADLYYNRYRDYDTTTGRYIQADPIGLAGGASPYSYAMNNPLRYTDPTGQCPWCLGLVLGGGIVVAGYEYWLWNYGPMARFNPYGVKEFCPPALFRKGDGDDYGGGGGGISVPRGGDGEGGDDCAKEWADAYARCDAEYASSVVNGRMTGGAFRSLQVRKRPSTV
jgi:RHS repeat-associated protein